ncbi:transcriptional regulator [Mycolicibacter arupensis]|jgi:predicted transcriptional regulator|uniref:Transcriptional regulator n=1 Tax=Mycolicibacter arupensis TaxID=342002 RepID=A0A0F5MXR5_9MYCO|nr:helix-turn-helix domain-containing protein [Mycolicibacter arupensis]KKB99389.1 transcriptional regulator [Mycolicibacter arupensis]MCV7275480.1 transcriptional regulator [Mycolicibacter arupensis]ORA00522.1 transcriptional regulator [Mycolicibacter arupensis]
MVRDVATTAKLKKQRDRQLVELRTAYEGGASIRTLAASTGRSYGSVHSMLRESGAAMRSRGGPNHRARSL